MPVLDASRYDEADQPSPYAPRPPTHDVWPAHIDDMPQHENIALVSPLLHNPGIQHVRSIETLDQFNVQLCGTSAELDPWLLRHCKFDDVGMRSHGKIRIRTVGGVPIDDLVPVHFTVVDDSFYDTKTSRAEPMIISDHRRQDLNALVSPETGLRLISL
jgi:hypothetical protein